MISIGVYAIFQGLQTEAILRNSSNKERIHSLRISRACSVFRMFSISD